MPDKKFKGAVRTLKFKIIKESPEQRAKWKDMMCQARRLTNAIRRLWLAEHTRIGSVNLVKGYMAAAKEWHATPEKLRGQKPVLGVKAVPTDFEKLVRTLVFPEYATLNERVKTLITSLTLDRLRTDTATNANYSRWIRILCDDGEFPNSSAPQPIPFDIRNSSIIAPDIEGEDYHVELRLDRIPVEGQSCRGNVDRVKIQTHGKQCRSQADILKLIGSDYKFCGSSLNFNEKDNQYYLHIAYKTAKEPALPTNPDKTAFLRPMKKRPAHLRMDGRNLWLGGRTGRHVRHVRRMLLTERWGRQESYRYASSASKGHGRNRVLKHQEKYRLRWKDFVKTANHQMTSDAIKACITRGFGALVYYQPSNDVSRFLNTTGKVSGRHDSTGWDWAQLGTMLSYKCKQAGISLKIKKPGETSSEETAVSSTVKKTKRTARKKVTRKRVEKQVV